MNPSKGNLNLSGWMTDMPMEVARGANVASPSTSDSIASDDTVSRLAEAMSQALRSVSLPNNNARMVRGDVVPIFNPDDVNQNIEDWCRKVDEIREMFNWSDDVTIFNALSKLEGLANVWYKGLKSVKFTWNEWKEKLCRAFPASRDYSELLEEMMARKKRDNETFAQYFYEKQALLNACNIDGKNAVSCIIAGIRENHIRSGAKAANCVDPESLFEYLRCLNNDSVVTSGQYVRSVPKKNSGFRKRRFESVRGPQICFNCNKPGHLKSDCTKFKSNKFANKVMRCFSCQEEGHISPQCPKKRKTTESTK